MPPHILRFRLRLMRFSPTVQYVPGKHQTTADALSRAPVGTPQETDTTLIAKVESFAMETMTTHLASAQRLLDITTS